MIVTRIGEGVYRVEVEGRAELVYVAGPPDRPWAFWNGQVFRSMAASRPPEHRRTADDVPQPITAPMPATVLKILVELGDVVRKGDTLVIVEAMKMELPLRASGDAVVRRIACREGELVQADSVLVVLEASGSTAEHADVTENTQQPGRPEPRA